MMRRRIVAVVMAATLVFVAAGCGDDEPVAVATPTPVVVPTPTTEPATPTPLPTATDQPTATPEPTSEALVLLVAGLDGISLWSQGGTTPVLTGEPVQQAVPDLTGGLVFVRDLDGTPALSIEAMAAPGSEPVTVVEEASARVLWLEDVAAIDGRPTLVYRVSTTLPNDCQPGTECEWQYQADYLMIRDLETDQTTNLGIIGGFESGGGRFMFGGTRATLRVSPYGTPYSCVGVLPAAALLDAPDPDTGIGGGGAVHGDVTWLGPGGCDDISHEGCPPHSECQVATTIGISDDGNRAAIAWSRPPAPPVVSPQPLTLSVIDLTSIRLDELWSVIIGEPNDAPTWIDIEGDVVVVGRKRDEQPLPPVLVESDGTVIALDLDGSARVWITRPPTT